MTGRRTQVLGFAFCGLILSYGIAGCSAGGEDVMDPMNPDNAGLNASGTTNCVAFNMCPKAAANFGANLPPSGAFLGWTGEPVEWRVYGFDEDTKNPDGIGSKRRITVLLDKIPPGATITPGPGEKLDVSAQIIWTPQEAASGKFDIVVRDQERCELKHGRRGYCNSYKFLKEYDTRHEGLQWIIKDKSEFEEDLANIPVNTAGSISPIKVSDPSCGNPTTDAEIGQKVLSTFLEALQPGGFGKVTTSLITGSVGAASGGEPTPTEC